MKCVKRLACALLALLLACAGCMAEEEETEDALSDLAVLSESIGVAVELPAGVMTLNVENATNDMYRAVGLNPEAARTAFAEGNVAIWAAPEDYSWTLTVSGEPFEDKDYSDVTGATLFMLLNLWRQNLEAVGGTADTCTLFDGSDTRWLHMTYELNGMYVSQYETVDHGLKLDFRLVSAAPLTEVDLILMDSVVYHSRVKPEE